jgi:hypothetical protein
VVRDRDLQRGVDGLGAGVREEHVVEIAWRELDQPARELEARRMSHLERRRVLHRGELLADRLGDFLAAMAGVHAPQPRDAIEHLAAVVGPVVHALGARQQTRVGLELTIRRERHPECFEIGALGRCHGLNPQVIGGSKEGSDDKKIRHSPQILRKLFIAFGSPCRLS